jgi:hypothetical protein
VVVFFIHTNDYLHARCFPERFGCGSAALSLGVFA